MGSQPFLFPWMLMSMSMIARLQFDAAPALFADPLIMLRDPPPSVKKSHPATGGIVGLRAAPPA